ncbi:MAG: hypothetical protein E7629_01285 [Ruminococcaceae bacterium]|nr:hypothetical protein [Oscillospiraceae bacterium]
MKNRIKLLTLCLLCMALLFPLTSCKERYDLLYSEEHDGITYCVRGTGNTVKQIVVKEGDKVLWYQGVQIDGSVGNLNGNYGFSVLDLNFDGQLDLMIAQKAEGEQITYLCWLKSAEGYDYQPSETLSGLNNIKADERLKAIFGFSQSVTYEQEYGDEKPYKISTDTTTKYVWEDGKCIPHTRVSLSYFEKTDRYCYSVAYYDEVAKEFEISNDIWLTPEEYAEEDMSFLYYFK